MDLCLSSHRALLKALQAFEDGELALALDAPLTVVTTGGTLRLLDGVCFSAPDDRWLGAELMGWLEELDGLSGVGAWWRPGLRAVLRTRDGRVDVTSSSQDLLVDGASAASGVATHTARFIVAHGDEPTCSAPAPAHDGPLAPGRAPAPTPTHATMAPERATRAAVPAPAGDGLPLRERGLWRSTALVPWNLGQGKPVTRAPREPFGPLPPVAPPPHRPPVYTPIRAGVHTAPHRPPVYTPVRAGVRTPPHRPPAYTPVRAGVRTLPPPPRDASSVDLSHVA